MIKVVNVLLFLLCLVLGYFLVRGIVDPIKSKNEVASRNTAVYDQLLKIRDSQEAFRGLEDKFASNFDTLKTVIKNNSFEVVDIQSGEIVQVPMIDSLFGGDLTALNQLENVPNSSGAKFDMDAGFLQSPNDSTLFVPVFEASTYTEKYMEGVNTDFWEAEKKVKVGSMTAPITSGNWE